MDLPTTRAVRATRYEVRDNHVCIAVDEPFVGKEVDGRYIRIYGGDAA